MQGLIYGINGFPAQYEMRKKYGLSLIDLSILCSIYQRSEKGLQTIVQDLFDPTCHNVELRVRNSFDKLTKSDCIKHVGFRPDINSSRGFKQYLCTKTGAGIVEEYMLALSVRK